MNDDLKALHAMLLAQHAALYQKLDQTAEVTVAKAILTEMQELLHRINLVQGLLFKQSTTQLQTALKKVEAADAELTKALKSADKAAKIVKGIAKFLTYVDKAIDIAKAVL